MKLNKYLQPPEAPVTQTRKFTKGVDFDLNNDNNIITSLKLKDLSVTTAKIDNLAVTSAKINDFSFNSGQGGTLTLGGTANGNGVMKVNNSLGSAIVTADNAGILVEGGNIVVKNADNTTIIDTEGIVSTASFLTASVEDATTRTTTSSTFVDVSGGALTAFVTTRATKAIIFVSGFGYNIAWLQSATAMQLQATDSVDGVLVNFPITIESKLSSVSGTGSPFTTFGYSADYQFVSSSIIADLTAGTHTLKLQYKTNGSGTAELALTQLGYVILGV